MNQDQNSKNINKDYHYPEFKNYEYDIINQNYLNLFYQNNNLFNPCSYTNIIYPQYFFPINLNNNNDEFPRNYENDEKNPLENKNFLENFYLNNNENSNKFFSVKFNEKFKYNQDYFQNFGEKK